MRIGDWQVEEIDRALSNAGERVHLTPRSWDVLMYLASRRGQLVEAGDLLSRFWRGALSEESAVRKAIHEIRHVLDDDPHTPRYVKTVPKKGYVLVALVEMDHAAAGLVIAVLPFINLNSRADDEYLGDGIAEEIRSIVGLRCSIPVISRTSSLQFKTPTQNIRQIGFRLGVSHIIEGSVRRADGRLRATAQLVASQSGHQLWSGTYDRVAADSFGIQDEIAKEVATAVNHQLGPSVLAPPDRFPSVSQPAHPEAVERHMRGIALMQSGQPDDLTQAIDLLKGAVQLAPDFLNGWLDLARAIVLQTEEYVCTKSLRDVLPEAESAIRRVLGLDPDNGSALGLLGWLEVIGRYNFDEGLDLFERAMALGPNDSTTMAHYGYILSALGDPRAERVLQRSYQLDPLAPSVVFGYAIYRLFRGEQVEALRLMNSVVDHAPDSFTAQIQAGLLNAFTGNFQVAATHLVKARQLAGPERPAIRVLEYYVALNKDIENQEYLNRQLELINELSKTELTPLLVTMGWPESLVEEIWLRAIDQRQRTVVKYACAERPSQMSEECWNHVQAAVGVKAYLQQPAKSYLRAAVDRAALVAARIEITAVELERYTGEYHADSPGTTLRLERSGTELWAVLPDSGDHHQLIATGQEVFEFYGFYGRLNFLVADAEVLSVTQTTPLARQTWQKDQLS